jgi:hypothetical protein
MFKLKKNEKNTSIPILCAQWKKKSFWEFAHGAKHIRKKPHGIIIIALLSVIKKVSWRRYEEYNRDGSRVQQQSEESRNPGKDLARRAIEKLSSNIWHKPGLFGTVNPPWPVVPIDIADSTQNVCCKLSFRLRRVTSEKRNGIFSLLYSSLHVLQKKQYWIRKTVQHQSSSRELEAYYYWERIERKPIKK